MTRRLVILCHGVNARGRDIAGVARGWSLPGVTVLAPDAPDPSDETPMARQWFSIKGVTADSRPGRVQAARPAFDRLIEGLVAAQGLTGRPDRVALVGFSQGAIMVLDAVSRGRWPVAAAVAFSGRYATPLADRVAVATPVLVIHGLADPAIPPTESQKAETCLRAQGCDVSLTLEPGLGHGVSVDGARQAGAFLRRGFGL